MNMFPLLACAKSQIPKLIPDNRGRAFSYLTAFINHLINAASPSLKHYLFDKFPFGIHSTWTQRLHCGGACLCSGVRRGRPSQKSPLCSNLVKRAAAEHHERLKEVSLLIISDTSHQTSFASVTRPLLSSAWRHFLPNHSLLWDLLSARTELIQLMGQTLSICWKNGADWIQSLQTKAGKCTGRQRRFVEILVFGRGYWWRQAKDAGFALVNTKVTLQALHF